MSVFSSRPGRDPVVTALRAAGCVLAEDEAALLTAAARTPAELDAMVARRVDGLPLEHVLGWAEFRGVRTAVEPGVFVPRRRSEFLVDQAVAAARPAAGRPLVVADLCCGSGAVGAALATALRSVESCGVEVRGVEVHAVDIDAAAVACARRNLAACGGRVYEGDLYSPLPGALRGRIDVVVAVAPYVPTGAIRLMPPEARLHESRVALDGGPDGLDVVRRVISGAPAWLAPRGRVLVETSAGQAPRTAAAMTGVGLTPAVSTSAGQDATVVIGSRAAPEIVERESKGSGPR